MLKLLVLSVIHKEKWKNVLEVFSKYFKEIPKIFVRNLFSAYPLPENKFISFSRSRQILIRTGMIPYTQKYLHFFLQESEELIFCLLELFCTTVLKIRATVKL